MENYPKAIKSANENIAAKKADVPFECSYAIKGLKKANSDWANGKIKELAKVCYVDLGKVILEEEAGKKNSFCGFRAEKIIKQQKELGVSSPETDALIKSLGARCAPKAKAS